MIQGRDGTVHAVYSFHRNDEKKGKTIKYVRFNEAWALRNKPRIGE